MGTWPVSRVLVARLAVVAVVSVMAIGAAEAAEVLSNPGFESGALSPWTTDGTWAIETTNCHSGSYCASDDGNYFIQQTFPGIPTNQIASITFWMRQPSAAIASYQLGYSDGSSSGTILIPTSSWTQFDVTSNLDSGKGLTRLTIWGYVGGGPGPFVTVLDDVSIQSQESIPALGWKGLLALALAIAAAGALLARSRFA
ncbi:MAG: hypothetical protein LAO05_03250 [Acidobacteriia bacterium]|nr:hypothetical protein [Terriglobia bacterium]